MSMPASSPGFSDRLITLLTQAGLRPVDPAARPGVPLEVPDAGLRGELPEAMALYRIAKALDVTIEWLLTQEQVLAHTTGVQHHGKPSRVLRAGES